MDSASGMDSASAWPKRLLTGLGQAGRMRCDDQAPDSLDRRRLIATDLRLEPEVIHHRVEHRPGHQPGPGVVQMNDRRGPRRVPAPAIERLRWIHAAHGMRQLEPRAIVTALRAPGSALPSRRRGVSPSASGRCGNDPTHGRYHALDLGVGEVGMHRDGQVASEDLHPLAVLLAKRSRFVAILEINDAQRGIHADGRTEHRLDPVQTNRDTLYSLAFT